MSNIVPASNIFKSISEIEDVNERKERLREECIKLNPLAIIIQYAYHPDMIFDLPEGEIPKSLLNPSYGITPNETYRLLKHFHGWRNTNPSSKNRKEQSFIKVINMIFPDDVPVYVGIKDKKLPYEGLDKDFCVWAMPELFPLDRMNVSEPAKKDTDKVVSGEPPKRGRGRPKKVKEE